MRRLGCLLVVIIGLVGLAATALFTYSWWVPANLEEDTPFIVASGSTLTGVAHELEKQGVIDSADGFLARAKFLGSRDPIQAGEFMLPAGASPATILDTFQHGDVIRRFVTIPEGMPSIMVYERLMSEKLLTGDIDVPAEGSVLPESYDFERGEARADVLARMQQAMTDTLAELWPERAKNIAVKAPEEAVILASIVEKETGISKERRMVAGLYSNRVKQGMLLQADPTIIYPITKGKPLGRRIRQSEIAAVNGYNTYTRTGLPRGPITNPGRASIEAVLHPANTDALYMVADGKGGHVFSTTLEEHNRNVEKWFEIRRKRGEM
ncbi:endolytic transglycosylase MltG [Altericroceibacterium spongiae]|uniref:Endolytic murein transglycosylase n=1 Tax=Altericroceibacterium spongiae TaxID=2320269 RepID=A0A420EN24_9SPHN|nr:endolytic transglycosylase MltG [Altericroceibacterium spongiae]RKF22006.1 endolytic transglycosylase MltG [Altericroceibacterium spongiae]